MNLRHSLFKEYLRDKNVIIVGNNLDSLEKKNGDFIDGYDRVIRLGKGIPNTMTQEYIGTFTHAWASGELRLPMKDLLAKGTQVLFNPSISNRNAKGKWMPLHKKIRTMLDDSNYIQMYNQRKIDSIKEKFDVSDYRRLSGGAILSHWITHACRGWKSLTFINFDCFKKSMVFTDTSQGRDSISSSYHMPLLGKQHMPEDFTAIPYGHPAHDVQGETRLFLGLLTVKNTHWIGDPPSLNAMPQIIKTPNVIWSKGRTEKKEVAHESK
tara:strand:+ start:667 stop:1467 length:801 start_codon:yes stop_codon:yes gene_type:complete